MRRWHLPELSFQPREGNWLNLLNSRGLESTGSTFNPTTDAADLRSVDATGHELVHGTVNKTGGQATALQLQMKRGNDTAFETVGMFTAPSYDDHIVLAVPNVPEVRQYQLLAMKNDVVIGQPSPVFTVKVS